MLYILTQVKSICRSFIHSSVIIADIRICPDVLWHTLFICMLYGQTSYTCISALCHPVLCPGDPHLAHGGPLSPPVGWVGGLLFAPLAQFARVFSWALWVFAVLLHRWASSAWRPSNVFGNGWVPCRSCSGGLIRCLSMAHFCRVCDGLFPFVDGCHGDVWGSFLLCVVDTSVCVWPLLSLSLLPSPCSGSWPRNNDITALCAMTRPFCLIHTLLTLWHHLHCTGAKQSLKPAAGALLDADRCLTRWTTPWPLCS